MKIKVVDLFAGIGGLSSPFENNSLFSIDAYEADLETHLILQKRISSHHCTLNLSNIKDIEDCDILVGGPPCQPFSKAGSQKGEKDERNHLPTFLKAIKLKKPKIFVMENVENLASKHIEILNSFIRKAEKYGYNIHYKILDASHFEVPQKRKRLFVVGVLTSLNFIYHWPKPNENQTCVKDIISEKAIFDDKFKHEELIIDQKWLERIHKYELKSKTRERVVYFSEPCRTITTKNLRGKTNDVIRWKIKGDYENYEDYERMLTIEEACLLQTIPYEWLKGNDDKIAAKIIGNSVPPRLAFHVLKPILEFFKIKT